MIYLICNCAWIRDQEKIRLLPSLVTFYLFLSFVLCLWFWPQNSLQSTDALKCVPKASIYLSISKLLTFASLCPCFNWLMYSFLVLQAKEKTRARKLRARFCEVVNCDRSIPPAADKDLEDKILGSRDISPSDSETCPQYALVLSAGAAARSVG